VPNFFKEEPLFAQAIRAKRQQVLQVKKAPKVVEMIRQWLHDTNTLRKVDTVLDFSISFLIIMYRNAI